MFFFFNDTATTEIYTLSLHDALPISELRCDQKRRGDRTGRAPRRPGQRGARGVAPASPASSADPARARSEEHTSELQSLAYLVCRLLLEKKKKKNSRAGRPCCVNRHS